MASAIWTSRAVRHLEDIAFYIEVEQERFGVAEKIVRDIHKKCDLYATNPDLGQARPDLGASYRCFIYKAWVVIYSPIEGGIGVEAVYHGGRDYPRIFRGESDPTE